MTRPSRSFRAPKSLWRETWRNELEFEERLPPSSLSSSTRLLREALKALAGASSMRVEEEERKSEENVGVAARQLYGSWT
jgi:hypothetical protein